MKNVHASILTAFFLTCAAPAAAQNLLTNPRFDTNASGWNVTVGTAPHTPGVGAAALGAVTLATPAGTTMTFSQCVAVGNLGPFDARVRTHVGGGVQTNSAVVRFFSTVECAGMALGSQALGTAVPFVGVQPTNWFDRSASNFMAPASTGSVLLEVTVEAAAGQTSQLFLDDALFAPAGTPVTIQKFTAE
ncbi:MAG: hypothetical protein JNK60_09470 [Acidobacteria bacterium]|nr:hypothetical protein [Acidobacteriota bacterium]